MIEVFILGTSSSFPTERRSHPCIVVRYEGNYFLFDAGENAQLQMRRAGISPLKIDEIFITHWHGDHTLGLPGLIQSMSMNNRERELRIWGPPGTNKYMYHILRCCSFGLRFKITVQEIEEKDELVDLYEGKEFKIRAIPVLHDIPAVSYSFETKPYRKINLEYIRKFGLERNPILKKLQSGEKILWRGVEIDPEKATVIIPGRKFVYSGDTKFCENLIKISKDADVLLIESTYLSRDRKISEEKFHLTAEEAGIIGKVSNARLLILTHFSQRYNRIEELILEAKKEFENVIAAEDFMKITIKRSGEIKVERVI